MITYLKAQNFQKHEHIELEFTSSGMALICGENWAGKTTILRAILYGLFGPSGVPGGVRAVQRRGCDTKPVVELGFSLGTEYQVRRTASVTRLFKQGTGMIANGTRPVNDAIRELLGMDGQTFGLLKYAPQEQAGAILTLGAEKLSKLINQITGVTLVEQVIEKASHEGSTARSMLEQMDAEDPKPLEKAVVKMIGELKTEHEALLGLNEECNRRAEKVKQGKETLSALRARWAAKQQQLQEIATLQGSLATLREQLNAQPLYQTVPDREKLREDVQELQASYDAEVSRGTRRKEVQEQIQSQQRAAQQLKQWLDEVRPKYLECSPVSDQEMEELQRLQSKAYQDAMEAYNAALQVKKSVDESVCPTCRRPMEGVDKEELKKRFAEAAAKNMELSKAYEERSAEVQQAEQVRTLSAEFLAKQEEARQIEEALSDLCQQASKLSAMGDPEFALLEDALHDAKEALRNAEVAHETNLRNERHLIDLRKRIADGDTRLRELNGALDDLTEQQVKGTEELVSEMEEDATRLQTQYHKDMGLYRENYARYEALNARWQAAQTAQRKLVGLQKRSRLCAKLAKYLRTNRDRFTKEVWQALLVSASSFAQLATNGQIQKVLRTDDGAFEYVETGHSMAVEAASGVQRAVLGVGVRLAIAEALRSPVDFLLLDEVTAGATDEVSLAVARTLSHAQQQVIMVTHRQSDAAVADQMINIGG